ncbi:MAG: glutamine amidotransferase [Gaiellaceae bacterium]
MTEVVEIGPTSLVRHRQWANLQPLAEGCTQAGLSATILPSGALPGDLVSPTVWLLSDLPFLAAESFGILDRLAIDVPTHSGLVMIGGAFSFSGLKAVGGWQDPRGAALLPVEPMSGADDTEAPAGVRLVPAPDCPREFASLLGDAPPFFGYNRLRLKRGSRLLARFDDGQPALVVGATTPCRTVAFASDLLPHWGPTVAAWDRFPGFLGALCSLAAGEPR